MQSNPKKKKPPDQALSVTFMHSTICFPLCLSCAVTVGFHLPCSVLRLRCLALGIYSKWVSSQWPIQLLRARSPPWVPFCFHSSFGRTSFLSSITVFSVFVAFLYQLEEGFGSELRPWRLLSLGLSSPDFSVGCGDLVSDGCRRSSISAIVQLIRSRGSRSGFIESLDHKGLTRSVSIASFCSFPRNTQVCYYLSLLFHIVLIDYIRTLFSIALRLILFDPSDYWTGLLSFTMLWRCLNLSWPIHVVVCDVGTCWCSSWHVGVTKSCNLRIWALERPVYGLVSTQTRFRRPPGNARLFLNLLMIESSALNCSPVWVSFVMLWPLLLFLHFLSLYTQRVWPTWLVHLLLLVSLHLNLVSKPPHGGCFHNCMMRLCSSTPTVRFVFFLYWGLPFLWLSLLLGRLITLKHEPLCSCFCWQLSVFQMVGDEVKGKSLFVYEDMLSETSLDFLLDNLLDLSRIICMFVWHFGTSPQPSFPQHTRRAASRFEGYNRAFGATASRVDPFTLLFSFFFGSYCSFTLLFDFCFGMKFLGMIVVERMQCIYGTVVRFYYGCCIPSYINCNDSLSRDSEQHLCVLGLCLMAPDQHPWMLGPAHHGLCLNRCFGMCLLALDLYRRMLGFDHRGLGPNRSIDSTFANRLCSLVRLRTLNCLMRLRLQRHRFIDMVVSK